MNLRRLTRQFATWRTAERELVMATVVHTAGSTYAKPGEFMLFDLAGDSAGLLSGGCLEPDLFEHARVVGAGNEPRLVTYDMRNRDEDELWGLGLGCDGLMQVLLQRIDHRNAYQPFAAIAGAVADRRPGVLVLDVGPAAGGRLGRWAYIDEAGTIDGGLGGRIATGVRAMALACTRASRTVQSIDGEDSELLFVPVELPLRLLLLGAGPDAVPVMRLGQDLGWDVTVADHRPHYLDREAFRAADATCAMVPAELPALLSQNDFDAAVVMSHHLASDRDYLKALAATGIAYVGLLGPPARRRRLLDDLGAPAEFAARLHGPVGLDIGARGPDAIALSIVAQIHTQLCRHD